MVSVLNLEHLDIWLSTCVLACREIFVFCCPNYNCKHSQVVLRLVSVSSRSLYIYSSWAFMGIQLIIGGVSMLSMICILDIGAEGVGVIVECLCLV